MSVEFYRRRGKRSKNAPPLADTDSDDEPFVSITAYRQTEIDVALRRREDFVRAAQELKAMLKHVFSRAAKQVQVCMVDDVKTAIKSCDGSTFQVKALAELVTVAEQTLPKSKREAVQREFKQAQVELHRKLKKGRDAAAEQALTVADLPDHLQSHVLKFLDPLSLTRAAQVSRTWRVLASEEVLWSRFFPAQPKEGTTSSLQRFRENEQLKQRWQSRRVVISGALAWKSAALYGEEPPGCYPISIAMVLSCLLGCMQAGRDGSESSESEVEGNSIYGRLWAHTASLE